MFCCQSIVFACLFSTPLLLFGWQTFLFYQTREENSLDTFGFSLGITPHIFSGRVSTGDWSYLDAICPLPMASNWLDGSPNACSLISRWNSVCGTIHTPKFPLYWNETTLFLKLPRLDSPIAPSSSFYGFPPSHFTLNKLQALDLPAGTRNVCLGEMLMAKHKPGESRVYP